MVQAGDFLVEGELKRGELVQLFREWKMEEAPIQFVTRGEPTPRLKKFAEFASQTLAKSFV